MNENRIRGRITIEFTQDQEGGVHYAIDADDWIKHWADMNADTMAVARVPEAVIAARVLADMCVSGGVRQALKFAAQAVKRAEELRQAASETKQPATTANDEHESTLH